MNIEEYQNMKNRNDRASEETRKQNGERPITLVRFTEWLKPMLPRTSVLANTGAKTSSYI